jgi:DinB superfamily
MRKGSLAFCVVLLLTMATFPQQLTQPDREKGLHYLQQTENGVMAAMRGPSEAQMKFTPAPDRWSVAEPLEHISLAEDFILQKVRVRIMKAPAGATNRDTTKADAMVLATIPDRRHKAQAPGALIPDAGSAPAGCRQPAGAAAGCVRMAAVYRCAQRASHKTDAGRQG